MLKKIAKEMIQLFLLPTTKELKVALETAGRSHSSFFIKILIQINMCPYVGFIVIMSYYKIPSFYWVSLKIQL